MFDDSTLVSGRHLVYYASDGTRKPRRPPTIQSKDGLDMAADPDGTAWGKTRPRK